MRIVITGMGILSAIGKNKKEVMESIRSEKSGIDLIALFDNAPYDCKYAAEIKQYDPDAFFTKAEQKLTNRCAQFAIIAISEAVAQARLELQSVDLKQVGLVLGTSHGGLEDAFEFSRILYKKGSRDFTPETIYRKSYGGLLKTVARHFGITGVYGLTSIACASGANAIGMASDFIARKKAKYVICGGSDTFTLPLHAGFWGLKAISPEPTAPFSTGPAGITLGEGAAFFVIESLASAQERHAEVLGEIRGYALTNDAYHSTAPHPSGEGAWRCMAHAITNSAIGMKEIAYCNAHGTGTEANDSAEKNAIVKLYEDKYANIPPISSTKPFYGHATGASGAIELVISLLCLKDGILPPTLNFKSSRFKEPLDFVANKTRKHNATTFISNSFGFAGCNVALVASKFNGDEADMGTEPTEAQRIAITGMGGICCVGVGKEEIWKAFAEKKSAISKIKAFDVSNKRSTHASLIKEFNPRKYVRRLDVRRMDRISQLGSVAAALCLEDAGIKVTSRNKDDIGIMYAVSPGPRQGCDLHFKQLHLKGPGHPSQVYFPYSTQNSSLGQITSNLGLGGFSSCMVEANAALTAMGYAYTAIKRQYQDRIVTGGSDELYWTYHLDMETIGELAFDERMHQNGLFSSQGEGYVPGEGSAFLMLESYASARERNAPVYGEIMGYGLTIDNNEDVMRNDESGTSLCHAMQMAADEAGIDPGRIGLVLSSDRGLPAVAAAEKRAMQQFFGDHLRNVVYTTTRFNTGWLESSSMIFNMMSLLYTFSNRSILPIQHSGPQHARPAPIFCNETTAGLDIEYGMVFGVSREGFNGAVILKKSTVA